MTQPEALRLADELERDKWHVPAVVMQVAADELRRLHEAHDWQYKMAGERLRRIENLEAQRDAIQQVVDEQAEDEGLWFRAETAAEAYLQQELRRLHAAVEGER